MRILGLDWGEVRVGGAVSDPENKIAFPLETFIDGKNAAEEIKKIVFDLKVDKIVIGLPKNLAGEEGVSAKKVEEFVRILKENIATPMELIDERFTSVEAGRKLSEVGLTELKQRTMKDNIAAQIMLQQYLDTKINKKN